MFRDFWITIKSIWIADILDIGLVALMFFVLLTLMRRTRSPVAMRGLISMLFASFLIYFLAKMMNLSALSLIFERFWVVVVIVFVIIFQHDFKGALVELGQMRIFRAIFHSELDYIDEIVSAVALLANKKIGALIGIERRSSLRVYADTGTAMDGLVDERVLRTIFTPQTPLHDGAVIIRNDRIVAAGARLPNSDSPLLSKDLGMRHRAAIGLSEETDAIVVIVSEETGLISLVHKGQLERGLSADQLKNSLVQLLTTEELE